MVPDAEHDVAGRRVRRIGVEVHEHAERVVVRVQPRVLHGGRAGSREGAVVESQVAGAGEGGCLHALLDLADGRELVGQVHGDADHGQDEHHHPDGEEYGGPPLTREHASDRRAAPGRHRENRTVSICSHGMSIRPCGVPPRTTVVPRFT